MRTSRVTFAHLLVAVSAAALLSLSACGDDDTSSDAVTQATANPSATESLPSAGAPSDQPSDSPVQTVDVTIQGDSVEPVAEKLTAHVGDTVQLNVDSDRDGELHVHSTPEQTFDFGAGTDTFMVKLEQPGVVDVEEHVSDSLVLRILVK